MLDISLQKVKKTYYQKTILHDISFDIYSGSKIAIIGRNGAGKTTLFKLLVREETPDSGQVFVRKGLRMGLLQQMPEQRPDQKVFQVLEEGLSTLYDMKIELEKLEGEIALEVSPDYMLKRYGELLTAFEMAGGYEMDFKLKEISQAMKLDPLLQQAFEDLSGGEKTRVLFARLLLQSPDVLLLDEPTNHLDNDMLAWLEQYLTDYNGTVLMISHDRYFLDQVAQQIIELEHGQVCLYEGNYTWYAIEKEKKVEIHLKNYKMQQKKIAAIEAAIKRFELWGDIGGNEKFFKKANQFKDRLGKMDKIEAPGKGDLNYNLELENTRKSSQIVIESKRLTLGYEENVLLQEVDMVLRKGERLCLLGANGTGKSTFFKGILNYIQPIGGELRVSPSVSVGYIPQDIEFEDDWLSVLDWCIQTLDTSSGEGRNLLAHYGFKDQEVFRSLQTLSGGEKSRLKLVQLSKAQHTLLLLDEPTNHMDIPSREQLEGLLADFQGSLLVVSHDRYFIEMISSGVLWLHHKGIHRIEGGYQAYLELKDKTYMKNKSKSKNQSEPREYRLKDRPKTYQKEKIRLSVVEEEINDLEDALTYCRVAIEKASTDYKMLSQLSKDEQGHKDMLGRLYDEWAELSELLKG